MNANLLMVDREYSSDGRRNPGKPSITEHSYESYESEDRRAKNKELKKKTLNFIFMGPCILRHRGGIYDQQGATNSQ
jgi:hypothetical protein